MLSAPDAQDLTALLAGTPYRALARIASGGMGEVFEVEHELLGRRFAAKVLHARLAGDAGFVERMRLESQATARLRHPHIVEVVDFCLSSTGRPCLIMEKLRGRTLARELGARGQLPLAECFSLLDQLLSALAAAHRMGVVHRDLKPDNLFLHEGADGKRRLKVLDFGFARVLPTAPTWAPLPSSIPTGTGRVVGSPGYVSPEALTGQAVDHRADLYAAGILLFLVLTGHGPFDHLTIEQTLSHAAAPPSRFRDDPVLRELDEVVLRALKKRPEDRFQTAAEFSAALSVVQNGVATGQ